jgi:hypothetical protein
MKTYSEKLKDPRWQRKRLEIMQRDNFKCTQCGDTLTTLNIHHWKYNGDPWEAGDENLSTVCEKCHKTIEKIKKEGHPITKNNAQIHILFGYDYRKPLKYDMFIVFLGDVSAKLKGNFSLMNDGNTLLIIEILAKPRVTLEMLKWNASLIISDCLDIGEIVSSKVKYEGVTLLWFTN